MNENPENFDKLVKLLALKRHEQPPPGYYDRLSGEIMARLKDEATEGSSSWFGDREDEVSWTRKILALLETRPSLAGFFGVAVSSLLLGGVIYSQKLSETSVATETPAPSRESFAFAAPLASLPASQSSSSLLISSTNPVVDPLGPAGLFDGVRLRQQPPVPVSLTIGN